MKYQIITYGCQLNKSDSERIAAVLEKAGYKPALKINETDLTVINMCSIRQSAVDRVFGLIQKIQKLKTKNYKPKIILTGCVLEKDKEKFKNKVNIILDIEDLSNWSKKLKKLTTPAGAVSNYKSGKAEYLKIKPVYQSSFSAFVPIMTGCNNFCSFCVVPYLRGREISRPAKEIIKEVQFLIQKGYKEIWLLGQNVNRYFSNKVINFAKLLKMVNDIPGDFWIRFTSPNPADFSDELIETMAKCRKIAPYLNLPVQSGDNEILRKMNRSYTVEQYKNLVKKIRQKFALIREKSDKEITLSTDIIVGFPGETKKQFENTVKLFKEIKFDMAYIAQYSPRTGTAAAELKDDVPREEKKNRWKTLTALLEQTNLEKNKKYIGKKVEVLVEQEKNGFLLGKTKTYKTIKIQNPKSETRLIGKFVKVKIIDALVWGLKGEILL